MKWFKYTFGNNHLGYVNLSQVVAFVYYDKGSVLGEQVILTMKGKQDKPISVMGENGTQCFNALKDLYQLR